MSDTLSAVALRDKLNLIQLKPGLKFSVHALKAALPDIETALFFGKLYELNVSELARLLSLVFDNIGVVAAICKDDGIHSHELQDYIVELGYEFLIKQGDVVFEPAPRPGEFLPLLWEQLEVDVAKSIKEVAAKLADVVGQMPGKEGEMVFRSLMTVNAKRPILGDYRAKVHHAPAPDNLVILDCSGSMTEGTIHTIIEDVVALSYTANAHLAIVSNTTTHWGPGEYDVDHVLAEAEYGGTHYETLSQLLDRNWGVVVCIADYDSSWRAKESIATCQGHIDLALDISLVDRPTFLIETVGQLASEVRPLMVADRDLTDSYYTSW
jgi:hypothetical protein